MEIARSATFFVLLAHQMQITVCLAFLDTCTMASDYAILNAHLIAWHVNIHQQIAHHAPMDLPLLTINANHAQKAVKPATVHQIPSVLIALMDIIFLLIVINA